MAKTLEDKIHDIYDSASVVPGMTLRDYFAGQAIVAFMTWSLDRSQENCDTAAKAAARYARSSYLIADAMLEARK